MKIFLIVFVFVCIIFNPVFLFAQRGSKPLGEERKIFEEQETARQREEAANKDLDAQLQKANAEVEQIRLNTQEQTLKDMKQAENDLERSILEFQEEQFPEEIEEE